MKSLYSYWVIKKIRERIKNELAKMAVILGKPIYDSPFKEILNFSEEYLWDIAQIWERKEINPHIRVRTSPSDSEIKPEKRTYRIGFYPVAANPFHWAHLLIGLAALKEFKLDQIIFVIAGFDPRKSDLAPITIRHVMGKEVLKIFAPFFGYSSIAARNNADGESNLFHFLSLNLKQKIEIFYIVGGDHYYRINPKTNLPDTIEKLERYLTNHDITYNDNLHRISAIFIKRGKMERQIHTFLPVYFLPSFSFEISSTMIREALKGKAPMEKIALLPYTCYSYIDKFQLYYSYSNCSIIQTMKRNFVHPVFGQI
ncbi:MAG: hypothetical protein N3A64_05530 [Desulfobacterota bacterium]|nr:hypothetical protein [Thermodesulfobacteriota bacterium]